MFDICHLQGTAKAQGHENVVIFSLLNFQFNATPILDHWTEVRFNGIASLFGRLDCHDLRDNARNAMELKINLNAARIGWLKCDGLMTSTSCWLIEFTKWMDQAAERCLMAAAAAGHLWTIFIWQ